MLLCSVGFAKINAIKDIEFRGKATNIYLTVHSMLVPKSLKILNLERFSENLLSQQISISKISYRLQYSPTLE